MIENLIDKARKSWVSIQSKEKTIGVYLKLIDSLMKPITLYTCECWEDSLKKDCFTNKIENFIYQLTKRYWESKKC